MKLILVPVGGSETDSGLFHTALALARPLEAHLQFFHVHIGAGEAALNVPHTDFAMGPALDDALKTLNRGADVRLETAREHFSQFCGQSTIQICDEPRVTGGVSASWQEHDGHALDRIIGAARHSDLILVGRAKKPNGLPIDFIKELVLASGRPVIISASAPLLSLSGTIMVCWSETAQAARAVGAAMPLLARANRIVLTTVRHLDHDDENVVRRLDGLARQLAWNGVNAEKQCIIGDGSATHELLFSAAQACAADLVVLGAYGHSFLHEVLFGGCTQFFVDNCDRAVLLMH